MIALLVHIFDGHLLIKQHKGPLLAAPHEPVWVAVFLLVGLALLVLVKATAFGHLQRVVQSTFSNQKLQQIEREEINLFRSHSIALNLLFLLSLAFLFYKLNEKMQLVLVEESGLTQYSFFLASTVGVMLFRTLANQFLAFSTGSGRVISEYLISSSLLNQTFGLVLFPLLAVLQFSDLMPDFFLYLSLGVVALEILLRWYRGLVMGLAAERLGFLQIFSYFCALEILPVLVLVKFVIETY